MKVSKWFIFLLLLPVMGLAMYAWPGLRVDTGLTALMDRQSEEYRQYEHYSRQFPGHDKSWAIIIGFGHTHPDRSDFLKVDSLCTGLRQLPGVRRAYDLASVRMPRRGVFGIRKVPVLRLSSEGAFEKSWNRLKACPDVTPKFLADDTSATCIYLELAGEGNDVLFEKVRGMAEQAGFPEIKYVGNSILAREIRQEIMQEMHLLSIIGGGILLVLFFVLFRDVRSLLVAALLIGFNASFTVLLFYGADLQVNMLNMSIPLLIAVLSFSDIVHVIFTCRNFSPEIPLRERIRASMQEIATPLVLTSLTTLLAFAVFIFSPVTEIAEFGWVTCAGIVAAYLSARFMLPVLLEAVGVSPRPTMQFPGLHEGLKKLLKQHRWVIRGGMLILLFLGIWTIRYAKIDNHLLTGSHPGIEEAQQYLNEHFGGTRSVEVVITGNALFSAENLKEVDRIEHYLTEVYGCTSVFSINTTVKRLNRFNHFGRPEFYTVPEQIDSAFLSQLLQQKEALGIRDAMSEDGNTFRIIGRLRDSGSADAMRRTEKLREFLAGIDSRHELFVSGHSVLQDASMYRVTVLILLAVGFSVLLATLIMGLYFRSWKLTLALLLPNVLPLLAAGVFLYLFDMDLNPFSAMALSILLGLSIDDTIYITGSCMRNRSTMCIGDSLGKNIFPVVSTSLLLASGFGVLVLSSLQPNKIIGLMVSLILLIALLSDLVLLPSLLKWAVNEEH